MPTFPSANVHRSSGSSGAFGVLAERLRRAGEFSAAIDLCRDGLAHHPGHVGARVSLGLCLMATGHDEEAYAELREALRLAPDNLAAIRGLAELHERGIGGEMGEPSTLDLPDLVMPVPVLTDQMVRLLGPSADVPAPEAPTCALESIGPEVVVAAAPQVAAPVGLGATLRIDALDPELPAVDADIALKGDFVLGEVFSTLDPAPPSLDELDPPVVPESATLQWLPAGPFLVHGAGAAGPVDCASAIAVDAASPLPPSASGPTLQQPWTSAVATGPVVLPAAGPADASLAVAAAGTAQTAAVPVLTEGPAAILEEWLSRIHSRRQKILSKYPVS